MPSGSFYMMIKIDMEKLIPHYKSSMDVFRALVEEQNISTLPGEVFNVDGFFRIVLTAPLEILIEGCNRIKEFFENHFKLMESEKRLKSG